MQMGQATSRIRLPEFPSEDLKPAEGGTNTFINGRIKAEEHTSEMQHVYKETNLKMTSCLYPLLPVSNQRLCYVSIFISNPVK